MTMNIEFKCPQCGNAVAVDESYRGQVVECPHCAKGIVVPRNKTSGQAVQRPESKVVSIQCPHCGTEYEATQQDMHRLVSCEICGKNFVAGTTSRKQSVGVAQPRPTTQTGSQRSAASRPNQMPRPRPFIAIGHATPEPCTRKSKLAIWIAAGAACFVVMLSLTFILGRHSNKPNSPAKAVAMMQSEDSETPRDNESVVSASNEANVKSSEEMPLGNGADIDKKEKGATVQAGNESGEAIPEETPFENNAGKSTKTESEEVATTNNEDETPVRPSTAENTDRASGTGGSGALFGGSKLKGKNPLELFRFGDAPRDKLSEKNMVEYDISGFLGIQKMILRYTTKGHLCSICLVSEDDHCSASESDARVSKLMQLCDEWYEGIKWNVDVQKHDGRKFAIGRINSTSYVTSDSYQPKEGELTKRKWIPSRHHAAGGFYNTVVYNYRDMVFSIVPTRGERNVVGLQVNLVDNRRRRLENAYLNLDMRRPLRVTDAQYKNAKAWLEEQKDANGLRENQTRRDYDGENLYAYSFILNRKLDDDHREVQIGLENGVLRIGGAMPIDESYAEELINAKIIIMSKEFEGITGKIFDNRPYGPGGHVELPCPICKGNKSRQVRECKCWDRGRKRNAGYIHISKRGFEEEFEVYKSEYKTGVWTPPTQPTKKKKSIDYVPLNKPSGHKRSRR